MYIPAIFRRFLCAALTVCLLLSPAAVSASETPEETVPPADTTPETTSAAEISAEESLPAGEEEPFAFSSPYRLYFGLLHAHTDISDGTGTVEEAFSHAASAENLDFFAVTDHSNSFDNADSGEITLDGSTLSAEWAAGKAAAAAVTGEDFLGIFGYEMTWPEIRQLGHITTYATPGWLSRDREGFADDADALEHYFESLATVSGSVSQFCHPGKLYGDFDRFGHYQPEYDDSVHLLETLGQGSLSHYFRALDAGWHLAPTASQNTHNGSWGSENGLRSVVLAETLTEDSFFDAIRARRVYATEDPDLHITYELDGQIMGSVLSRMDNPEVFLSVYDPTDEGGCTLEVIGPGGVTLYCHTMEEDGDLDFTVPGGYRWYLVKLTQADGDVAVTAPVWVEGFENMGIAAFTADRDVPLQGQPLTLNLELYNEESVDFPLDFLELYTEDTLVYSSDSPGTLRAEETLLLKIPYTHTEPGYVTLCAVVRGTVLGRERSYEETLRLRFRPAETTAPLLIDGSHGSPENLTRLKALAAEAGLETQVFTGPMPPGGRFLIIPPMEIPPDADHIRDVSVFLETGGMLILLGDDTDNTTGNTLLEGIGSGMRLGSETIPTGPSGSFNRADPLCDSLSPNQLFLPGNGTRVEPGSGVWLVKDDDGNILLARESLGGGAVFAAGSPFLTDEKLPPPQSIWQMPSANQSIFQSLLGAARPVPQQQDIRPVRALAEGTLCRVKGYVTAGTSDPNTFFPGTIYLQDETGGIAVTGITASHIQIGAPMEVIGVLKAENGVLSLICTDYRVDDGDYYHFTPETGGCKTATDYSLRGGELVQVEGKVTALTKTEDGKGIRRLTLEDLRGDSAVIEIEDTVRSGSTGKNTLAKSVKTGRTVTVLGLVHRNAAGETVIRVRDCDEVVYIPPKADPSNPKTADPFRWFPS